MANDYILSCESTADLSAKKFKELDVHYICFHYYLDGKEYPDDLGQSIPFDQFYQAMVDGAQTKTAALSAGEYEEFFRELLEKGKEDNKDILHVCLSSGLSSTFDSATVAARNLKDEFPNQKIYVVDSLGASSGYGLIMQKLSDMRADGVGIEEAYNWIEENKLRMHHWFFSTDLTFYIKGGRVKPMAGYVGNLLGVCPLLNMNTEGKLIPRFKCRGKKKAIKRIVEEMHEHAHHGVAYNDRVFLSQSACPDIAKPVADAVRENFADIIGEPEMFSIGTTIGSHTGPGTVALYFWGDERTI